MKCSLTIITVSPDRASLQNCPSTFAVEVTCANPRDRNRSDSTDCGVFRPWLYDVPHPPPKEYTTRPFQPGPGFHGLDAACGSSRIAMRYTARLMVPDSTRTTYG